MKQIRLALFGAPGAGKSTTTGIIEAAARRMSWRFDRLRLADPLYRCQQAIYEIAGRPLENLYSQDGVLLNFLGAHLRRINPSVLLDQFDRELEGLMPPPAPLNERGHLIVCDDMRATEADFLKKRSFILIRILAPAETCVSRRAARGDISLGSAEHGTEAGIDDIQADYTVNNATSLEDLRAKIDDLLEILVR